MTYLFSSPPRSARPLLHGGVVLTLLALCAVDLQGQEAARDRARALEDQVLRLVGPRPDSARHHWERLRNDALARKDEGHPARVAYLEAAILSREGDLDRALERIQEADALPVTDTLLRAKIKNFLGRISFDNDAYDAAMAAYLAMLELTPPADSIGIAITYNNLGRVYERLRDYDKAFEHFNESIRIYEALGDDGRAAGSLLNLGVVHYEQGEAAKAEDHFRRSLAYAEKAGDDNIASIAWESLGNVLRDGGRYPQAMEAYGRAMDLSEKMNSLVGIASVSRNIGEAHLRQDRPDAAIPPLERCLAMADSMGSRNYRKDAFFYLAQAHKQAGRPARALDYLERYGAVKDSIMNDQRNEQIADLEVRFDTERKDRRIVEQELALERSTAELVRKDLVNRNIGIALAAVVLVSLLLVLNFRQKRRLDKERLATMAERQKVAVMQALVNGEERERTRIAKDLHDGLNGTLATVKMYVNGLPEQAPQLQGNERFSTVQRILEETTAEVRRISHDLMPNVLLRQGLPEALKEYCDNIDRAGVLSVSLQVSGMEERLDPRFELTLYRIIQELMNNIVKHAKASQVNVQVYRMDDVLQVTVEDDGIGFDPRTADRGLGLESIRSRVEMLEGRSDIKSDPGMGTSVHMEFHLRPTPSTA